MSKGGHRRHSMTAVTDVNIVPIVDCLVMLITFGMAAGTFVSIGALQVGVSTTSQQETVAEKPPVQVFVDVHENKSFTVRVVGDENTELTIPSTAASNAAGRGLASDQGDWDKGRLGEELKKLSGKWPTVKSATVSGHAEILYQDLVTAMELTRGAFPDVVLGGF